MRRYPPGFQQAGTGHRVTALLIGGIRQFVPDGNALPGVLHPWHLASFIQHQVEILRIPGGSGPLHLIRRNPGSGIQQGLNNGRITLPIQQSQPQWGTLVLSFQIRVCPGIQQALHFRRILRLHRLFQTGFAGFQRHIHIDTGQLQPRQSQQSTHFQHKTDTLQHTGSVTQKKSMSSKIRHTGIPASAAHRSQRLQIVRKIDVCRDVQRTNYKGQFRSSARLRLAEFLHLSIVTRQLSILLNSHLPGSVLKLWNTFFCDSEISRDIAICLNNSAFHVSISAHNMTPSLT